MTIQRLLPPVFLLLIGLFVAPGCSKKQGPVAPQANTQPTNQLADIWGLPEQARKEMEAFARQLQEQINEQRTNETRAAFDRAAIVSAICEGIQSSGRQMEEFRMGLVRGLQMGIDNVVRLWSGQDATFKHLVVYKGSPAARFRFSSDRSGIALVDFVLGKNNEGKLRIVNFCNHAIAYDMIEQSRQTAAPMLADFDRTFLERLLQQPNLTPENIKDFAVLTKKFTARDFRGVIATYKLLPPALHDTLAATAMQINAFQQSGDDKGYKAALKEAAARFRTANFQFMLVDAYFLDKQYDKAAACLDTFMAVVEKDAALLALKASLLNLKGDVAGARTVLREALELEPDCVWAHSKGLDVLLAAKDWPAVRDSMVFLEKNAGHHFKGALTDPLWNEFKKAPESAPWR